MKKNEVVKRVLTKEEFERLPKKYQLMAQTCWMCHEDEKTFIINGINESDIDFDKSMILDACSEKVDGVEILPEIMLRFQMKMARTSFDDIQEMRKSVGNRILQNVHVKMGRRPSSTKDELEEEGKDLLDALEKEYKTIVEGIVTKAKNIFAEEVITSQSEGKKVTLKKFLETHKGIISNELEFSLMSLYMELLEKEKRIEKSIEDMIAPHPAKAKFFDKIYGVGPMTSSLLLSLSPYKARHASSFVRYIGIDVVDGEGRGKKHKEVIIKDGKEWEACNYNHFMKAKLVEVMTSSMIKVRHKKLKEARLKYIELKGIHLPEVDELVAKGLSKSAAAQHIKDIFNAITEDTLKRNGISVLGKEYIDYIGMGEDYRNRLLQREDIKEKHTKDGVVSGSYFFHIERMVKRKVAKWIVQDFWAVIREIHELPVSEMYEVAMLGHKPHKNVNFV